MFYVVQTNVFREVNYDLIFDVLKRLELPYEVVEFIGDQVEIKTERKDVFVFGSVRLARLCKERNWCPGSFYGDNHDYQAYAPHYRENLLNWDSVVQRFDAPIEWLPNEYKFMRPSKDSKAFVGGIFTETKWNDIVERNRLSEVPTLLKGDTPIQVASPKTIYREARCWIVDDTVVTSSYYKFHNNTVYFTELEPEGLAFANEMAKLYRVAEAYVMDICLTPDGWKIVEINCVNMSGFYNGDIQKLVIALEAKFDPNHYSIKDRAIDG